MTFLTVLPVQRVNRFTTQNALKPPARLFSYRQCKTCKRFRNVALFMNERDGNAGAGYGPAGGLIREAGRGRSR